MSVGTTLSSRFTILLFGRVLLLLMGLVATAILTRALGPGEFGYYRAAVAYLGLTVVIADLGLNSVFVRELSLPSADQPRVIGNAITLRLGLALITMLIAVLFSLVLNFERPERLGILLGAVGFLAYSLHLMVFGLFQQKLRQQGVVFAEVAGGIVLLLIIAFLVHNGAASYWFVLGLGVSYTFSLMIALGFARRLVPFRLLVELDQWRILIRAALPVAASGILMVLYVRADTVFLTLLDTPEAVGLYGIPIKISDSILGISLLLIGLFAPLFAKSAAHSLDDLSAYLERGLTSMLIGSVATALALNAVAPQLILLLGGRAFLGAVPMLRILTLFLVLHPMTLMLREVAVALHIQQKLVKGYVTGVIISFVLYVPLISRFGGRGASMTLVITELVVLLFVFYAIHTTFKDLVRFRSLALVTISGGAGWLTLVGMSSMGVMWWTLLVLTLTAYAGTLLISRAVTPDEVASLARGVVRLS